MDREILGKDLLVSLRIFKNSDRNLYKYILKKLQLNKIMRIILNNLSMINIGWYY